jgi:hypothetical protein
VTSLPTFNAPSPARRIEFWDRDRPLVHNYNFLDRDYFETPCPACIYESQLMALISHVSALDNGHPARNVRAIRSRVRTR